MGPDALGALVGGVVTGGAASATVIVRWLWPTLRTFKTDVSQVKNEIGVGTNGPSIVDLVANTANAVQRLEQSSRSNGEGITKIILVQEAHGTRLTAIENKHEALDARVTLAAHTDRIAELLEKKTEQIAKELAKKTDSTTKELLKRSKR